MKQQLRCGRRPLSLEALEGRVVPTFGMLNSLNLGFVPGCVGVGDLNHDGNGDLVAVNALGNSISVRLGNGNGTFGAPNNISVATGPVSVAIGDINKDGKADLVVAHSLGLTALIGNGSGTSF